MIIDMEIMIYSVVFVASIYAGWELYGKAFRERIRESKRCKKC